MKQPTRFQLLPSYERSFLVMRLQVELKLSNIAVVIHEDPSQPALQKLSFDKSCNHTTLQTDNKSLYSCILAASFVTNGWFGWPDSNESPDRAPYCLSGRTTLQ